MGVSGSPATLIRKAACLYLVWLPIEGGLDLKARENWPRAARVFCFQDVTPWDENAQVQDEAGVVLCRRRGAAIDLVLDRAKLSRSQFVFTTARGHPAIWWQTLQTARLANPGARVPKGRAVGTLSIALDTREKYGWRFAGHAVTIEHRALPAGDYAALVDAELVAVVERKTLADLASSLSNASLAFQMQRLAEFPRPSRSSRRPSHWWRRARITAPGTAREPRSPPTPTRYLPLVLQPAATPSICRGSHTSFQAFRARLKAGPSLPAPVQYRVRRDKLDGGGRVTVRYLGRVRHLYVSYKRKRTPVTLLIAGPHVRVVAEDGSVLRELTLDLNRNYQQVSQLDGSTMS